MDHQKDIFTVRTQDNTVDWADSVTMDTSWLDGLDFHDPPSGKLTLEGEDADILMDGMSVRKTLESINDRLAILQVNPELEAEFDELHALGEKYRALEQKIIEKKKMWQTLNK